MKIKFSKNVHSDIKLLARSAIVSNERKIIKEVEKEDSFMIILSEKLVLVGRKKRDFIYIENILPQVV